MAITCIKMNLSLPLLAIESAEELQRLKLKKMTNLENTKELSSLIKKDFVWRWDYSQIFSEAYFATHSKKISLLPSEKSKKCMIEIANKLKSPSNLKYEELGKLVNFCVNLSDYSAMYVEDMINLRAGGCFI
jgi:hypothetical protein